MLLEVSVFTRSGQVPDWWLVLYLSHHRRYRIIFFQEPESGSSFLKMRSTTHAICIHPTCNGKRKFWAKNFSTHFRIKHKDEAYDKKTTAIKYLRHVDEQGNLLNVTTQGDLNDEDTSNVTSQENLSHGNTRASIEGDDSTEREQCQRRLWDLEEDKQRLEDTNKELVNTNKQLQDEKRQLEDANRQLEHLNKKLETTNMELVAGNGKMVDTIKHLQELVDKMGNHPVSSNISNLEAEKSPIRTRAQARKLRIRKGSNQ